MTELFETEDQFKCQSCGHWFRKELMRRHGTWIVCEQCKERLDYLKY